MKREAFERLYEVHAQPLLGFLVYRTGDPALAEDILADTFERVYSARRTFNRRRASEKTWIYTIALNCLRDQRRRTQAEVRALERSGTVDRARTDGFVSESVEARDTVSRALVVLSEEEREAVALRYGADLTVPEIATPAAGAPINTRSYADAGTGACGPLEPGHTGPGPGMRPHLAWADLLDGTPASSERGGCRIYLDSRLVPRRRPRSLALRVDRARVRAPARPRGLR